MNMVMILKNKRSNAVTYVARGLTAVSPGIKTKISYDLETENYQLCITNWANYTVAEREAIQAMARAIHKFGEC